MKLPNCLKNLNSRKGNEKGSVTLFVLIAMLFFLMIGMMIFIINMNTETSQKRDVEKIKSEYNANTSETDLDQLYQEAKQRQIGTFMIKLIDKYGTIYNSGEWVNEKWLAEGRLPLTVQPNFPEGLKDISVTVKDDTYGGSTIITKTADLATMEIRADKDCQYTIENTLDNTNQVKINIDTTKPTIDELKGGTIWKGTEEEEITGTDAEGAITITARDNLSGVKELKYIINNSPEAPSADAEWTTVEGATAQVTINNEKDLGVYYIHIIATDVAGNASEVVTSEPYYVKQANYKITTTTGTTYSETLKDAAEKPGAMVIKVLNTFTDDVAATIAQNVTIDTNGKTLTMAETITVAAKTTATFVDNATTKGKLQRVVADGVRGDLITNSGIVNVGTNATDGATLESKDRVINGGTVTVYSGNIASKGKSENTDNAGIYSKTINVYGGNITNDTGNYGIVTSFSGTCNISGGTVSGKWGICPINGTLTISGSAEINGRTYGVCSSGSGHSYTLNMTGGNITSTGGAGIYAGATNNITITGGTVTGTSGIWVTGPNCRLTIGNNENALDRTAPVITGTNGTGINIAGATSTLNYYDGTIIGKTKGTKTFNGREVAFSVKDDTTVNFLTETEAGNVTRYYRPYTRENTQTHLFETVLEKQVNVTFNPGEGATVAENNRNVLTNVEYKEKAETAEIASLPTPERTGYTFKGWNGKNKFDESKYTRMEDYNVNTTYGYKLATINLRPNTTYKISVKRYNDFDGKMGYLLLNVPSTSVNHMYTSIAHKTYPDLSKTNFVLTTGDDGILNIGCSSMTQESLDIIWANTDVQIEEGTTATPYEPYYIVDNTKVVQDQDHTLNAIWEATPYTVTLNAGDGTIDDGDDGWTRAGDNKTATKDITYDSNYGTLPTASRTGYTFEGWFTEATGGTQITDTTKMQTASEQSLYAHWTANNYTVTAHANGGAIASTTGWEGTGESATKQVTYDSAYGTLPEVTKTGYTFKGWNGKNLFELKENVDWKFGATTYNVNTSENSICIDTGSNFRFVQYYLPVLKANTTYTISGNVELINTSRGFIRISKERNKQNGNIFIFRNDTLSDGYFSSTFTIGENDETTASLCLYGNLGSNEETGAIFSNIQIEEGSTATPYEPYYITEDTKVTTASDHTLKAVWETIPYTISYELNKGTNNSSNPTGYTIETENITLQNPTRNGYTFIGWTGSNGDTPQTTVTIPKGSTGDRTYTANWEEKTYTLTIKPNGGAVDGSTTDVVRNLKYSDVSNINDPTRTGYTFGGYNELSGAAYNNGLASISVYNNNNNNNGVVTATTQAKSADNPITGMSNEVKITNAGTAQTQPGLGGFLHGKHADANKKYVHVFVAKLPEGYYFQNANNKLGDGATTQWLTSNEGTGNWQTYVYQVNAGSAGTFENFGYVYVSTDKDNDRRVGRAETGAYTAYLAYSNIYDITSDDSGIGQIDGTGVLTANWTATPYVVTLNAGDGTIDAGDDGWARAGDNKTATKDITYDSDYGTLPTASRTGYTFDGWFTEATGGTKITDTTKMQTASAQTLYPHWTANPYTIHFNANGGTGEMTDLPMTYGTPANLTANAFSRTGYKFVKWTSNADGTGNEYIDGQTVNNLTEINNDTVNLFAQWEERPFVVTFNPNGGIVTPESKEITYNSTYGDLPSGDNIKRLGYTFAGWYKEAELTNEVTSETTYDITEDSTLYAKWTPHVYTVTFNKNGGTGTMSDQSFTYGQTQNLRANTFTRTGYTFAGWARAENGTIEFTNEQSISNLTPENGGTITLYAVWNDVTRPSWSVRLLDIINK